MNALLELMRAHPIATCAAILTTVALIGLLLSLNDKGDS